MKMYEVRGFSIGYAVSWSRQAIRPGDNHETDEFYRLDVHSTFCEGAYIDDAGREKAMWHEPTAIPELN